jgi:hypothetical protein
MPASTCVNLIMLCSLAARDCKHCEAEPAHDSSNTLRLPGHYSPLIVPLGPRQQGPLVAMTFLGSNYFAFSEMASNVTSGHLESAQSDTTIQTAAAQ